MTERYPIEYTKKVNIKDLKVGDTIEGEWLWDPRLVVSKVTDDRVIFLSGEEREIRNWDMRVLKLVKIRMSKTPEWFGK